MTALLACAALGIGCTVTFRDVPRDGNNEVPTYLRDESRGSTALEVIDSAPEQIWRANAGRGTLGVPAVGEHVTAIATVDRWVYAIDTRTGRLFWRWRADGPYGAGPVIGDGRVFAATEGAEGKLTAINLYSGKKRWQARIGDVAAPLTLSGGTVFGTSMGGFAFAYRMDNGRRLWTRVVGPSRSGALVLGRRAAVVTITDTLFVLDAESGAIETRAALPSSTVAPLALMDDSTAVAGSPSGEVFALSIPSGKVGWRVPTGDPVFGAPVVVGDTVYALTNRCTLWVIPKDSPGSADSVTIPPADSVSSRCVTVAGPTVVRDGVLVAPVGAEVLYYNRRSRRREWTLRARARGELRHPPIVRNGQIIVAPIVGEVVSFR